MNRFMSNHVAPAALMAVSIAFSIPAAAAGSSGGPIQVQGPGGGYGPMGPGMMYDWTPEQRQQHWEQMQQYRGGRGMMWNMTPEERERHWQWMRERGFGPGMMGPGMMGPGGYGPSGGSGASPRDQ